MKKAIITTAWCMCLLCSLNGCSGEETVTEQAGHKEKVLVTVNLNQAAWNTEQGVEQTKAPSQEVSIPVKGGVLTATLEPGTLAQTRSTEISYGVRYGIIAYKENDVSATGYVNHADFVKGGAASAFWLQTDKTYTFVCYSYNSAEAMPEFNKSTMQFSIDPTNDFLYGKKNVTITAENRSFALEMQHLFTQVTVIADASADGYAISACSGTFAPNYNATVSLADGSLTKGSSVSKTISWSSLGSTTVTSAFALVYTNGETVTATLNSITIDGTVLTNKSFTFTGKTMSTGKKYTLRLSFKGPSEKINGILLNSLIWAPGNLIGSSNSDGTFTYSFASSQEYCSGVWNGGDYFCWNTLNPYSLTSSNTTDDYNPATDPCRLVAPAGAWRMPTQAELQSLANTATVWTTKNNKNGRYFGIAIAPASGLEDNYLFLPTTGQRFFGDSVSDLDRNGLYWSATHCEPESNGSFQFAFNDYAAGIIPYLNPSIGLALRCVSDSNTTGSNVSLGDWNNGSELDGGTQTY